MPPQTDLEKLHELLVQASELAGRVAEQNPACPHCTSLHLVLANTAVPNAEAALRAATPEAAASNPAPVVTAGESN